MRDYETMFVFRPEDEAYGAGKQLLTEEFGKAGVVISKEEDMGNRELAYPIGSETRGHYHFYDAQISPDRIAELSAAVKLMDPILKSLFVRK